MSISPRKTSLYSGNFPQSHVNDVVIEHMNPAPPYVADRFVHNLADEIEIMAMITGVLTVAIIDPSLQRNLQRERG